MTWWKARVYVRKDDANQGNGVNRECGMEDKDAECEVVRYRDGEAQSNSTYDLSFVLDKVGESVDKGWHCSLLVLCARLVLHFFVRSVAFVGAVQ